MFSTFSTLGEATCEYQLVLCIEKQSDIESTNLGLSDEVQAKIATLFAQGKNTSFQVFVGGPDYESILFLFYLDKKKEKHVFLGEQIKYLQDKVVFFFGGDTIFLKSILLRKYCFNRYKGCSKKNQLAIILTEDEQEQFQQEIRIIKAIEGCRDIVNVSPSEKTPEKYVNFLTTLSFKHTTFKVLGCKELTACGANLLCSVGRGGAEPPQMVILEHMVDPKLPTIGFVGKGITFDTGGLNIKVGNHMFDMKMDMAGSATLAFMMQLLDSETLKCNVVCALAIAENAISSASFRPGDILRSYSGKTVEIINTDAEGRLVLADGVSYLSKNYTLESITSIATLTGACIGALGYHYAGIMGNDEAFIHTLLENSTFDRYWRLPLDDFMREKTKGTVSDYVNLSEGVQAGAQMGAAFISNFCLNNEKYTHIDIAGTAMVSDAYGTSPVGATGFGVWSLAEAIKQYPFTK